MQLLISHILRILAQCSRNIFTNFYDVSNSRSAWFLDLVVKIYDRRISKRVSSSLSPLKMGCSKMQTFFIEPNSLMVSQQFPVLPPVIGNGLTRDPRTADRSVYFCKP